MSSPLQTRHLWFAVLLLGHGCGPARQRTGAGGRADASVMPGRVQSVRPAPLDARDFKVGRLAEGLDSVSVRQALGAPDSVRVEDHPFDVGAKLAVWWYPDVLVAYDPGGRVNALTLLTPALATARGLRVGDPAERVRALYGTPADAGESEWEFVDPREPSGLHVIRISLRNGRVAAISLGTELD